MGFKKMSASLLLMSCQSVCAMTDLYFLVSLVDSGYLVLLMQRRLVAEETHEAFVGEAEELDLLVVLAGVGAPLCVKDGVQWEG